MEDIIKNITIEIKETQEDFIYKTIYPYCEEIAEQKLNKKRLEKLLLLGMEKEKELEQTTNEKSITKWLIDNVFRNEKYYMPQDNATMEDMLWDLMIVIASLHNEYYKVVNGEYYDYMFHWVNKMNCGSIDDNIFKNKENN